MAYSKWKWDQARHEVWVKSKINSYFRMLDKDPVLADKWLAQQAPGIRDRINAVVSEAEYLWKTTLENA